MKKINKKGFTLIELIRVIILLGVIGVITVPVVKKIINNTKKESFKDSVYGIVEAVDLYYSEQDMLGNILVRK